MAGLGFKPDVAMVSFPIGLFMVDSDISPIKIDFDRFINGLTQWESKAAQKVGKTPRIAIEADDPLELIHRFNERFLANNWGDGLPLIPPTEERVQWILQGSDEPRDTRIGKFLPRGSIVTLETTAISLAMAGGRPEYLPVLVAALEAMFDPVLRHEKLQSTSCSTYPVVIVGGPIGAQIRLNSGFGLVGPDPRHPAGASIGRALRLLQQNAGGALPGVGTMAVFGGMRYTNVVFAEDEAGLPPDWAPFNEEYLGYAKGENTVGLTIASSASNILRRGKGQEGLEREALDGLYRIASYMRAMNANSYTAYREGSPGVLLLTRQVAGQMAALGWTKETIRQFLWEKSRIPMAEMEQAGAVQWARGYGQEESLSQDPWPITSKPENLAIVVAGGTHTTHAYWMQNAYAPRVVKARIQLPKRWDELLSLAPRSESNVA
ncbi:MAG: hypothetical protein JW384_00042 [Nitrosomonadaceae bacterium]|nr:hypothetical protein [Nitrosomonadaceae bacterium]